MARDNVLDLVEPSGLDGGATITADVSEYYIAARPCYLRALYSMVESAADFTTGDEQGRVIVDYTTNGSTFVAIFTGTLRNANLWTALVPLVETLTEAIMTTRIPAGANIRVRFDVSGTTPSFPTLHVCLGLSVV